MNVSGTMALRMFAKGAWNVARKYPLTISFEVTHACAEGYPALRGRRGKKSLGAPENA